MRFSSRGLRQTAWIAGGVVWLGVVAWGMAWLIGYDNRPGTGAHAGGAWPAESRVARDPGRYTLVMLAHPKCDCTRASLAELAELMARAQPRPKAYVLFIRPGGVPGDWERTDLWRGAAQIPDVTVLRDDDGAEARRFGGETSGQVLLYDAAGSLVFSGGTTGSRGHAGENAGRASILSWLKGADPHTGTTPVFGCSLFASEDEMRAQEAKNHHGDHRD